MTISVGDSMKSAIFSGSRPFSPITVENKSAEPSATTSVLTEVRLEASPASSSSLLAMAPSIEPSVTSNSPIVAFA